MLKNSVLCQYFTLKLHKKIQTLHGDQHCPVRMLHEIESVFC